MTVKTAATNIRKVTRYVVRRWEDPTTGELGWLVLDTLGRENGYPAPVDVFPTRKRAQGWIYLRTRQEPDLYRVAAGPHKGVVGTVRLVDQNHNVLVTPEG